MSSPLDLAIDINDTDTSRPIPVSANYIARIDNLEVKENKDQDGHNLLVTFALTAPATSVEAAEKGLENDIPAGFKINRYYPLQASKKPPQPGKAPFDFKKGLAELQDAALHTKQGERGAFNPEMLKGKEVIIVVKVRTQTDGPYAGQTSADIAGVRELK